MKRLILLVALVMAMAVLAPAAFADDDPPEVESDDVEMEEKDHSAAQKWKAQMIADYVGFIVNDDSEWVADSDEVAVITALRTGPPSVGWGVLFKLQAYEAAGMDPTEFLMDDEGYALGQIRKLYLDGDYDVLPYKNLGQLQKSYKDKPEKPAKVMPPQSNRNKDKHNG